MCFLLHYLFIKYEKSKSGIDINFFFRKIRRMVIFCQINYLKKIVNLNHRAPAMCKNETHRMFQSPLDQIPQLLAPQLFRFPNSGLRLSAAEPLQSAVVPLEGLPIAGAL